jgi:hypothetical protein
MGTNNFAVILFIACQRPNVTATARGRRGDWIAGREVIFTIDFGGANMRSSPRQ